MYELFRDNVFVMMVALDEQLLILKQHCWISDVFYEIHGVCYLSVYVSVVVRGLIVGRCALCSGYVLYIFAVKLGWFVQYRIIYRYYMLICIGNFFFCSFIFWCEACCMSCCIVFVVLNAICMFVCLNRFLIFLTSGL